MINNMEYNSNSNKIFAYKKNDLEIVKILAKLCMI